MKDEWVKNTKKMGNNVGCIKSNELCTVLQVKYLKNQESVFYDSKVMSSNSFEVRVLF